MSPPSRSSKSGSRGGLKPLKSYRPGKITRNPFFNFMRDFRSSNRDTSITGLIRKGAEAWRKMNDQQKACYFAQAKEAPITNAKTRPKKSRKRARHKNRVVSPSWKGRHRTHTDIRSDTSSAYSLDEYYRREPKSKSYQGPQRDMSPGPSKSTS